MTFIIFLGLGLGSIAWGLRSQEEIFQLSAAVVGTVLLVWGLCLTPQAFLLFGEILAVVAVFRICVRCCECDG